MGDQLAPRASGKRRRSAYNPYKWASSILSQRSKILLLGMSYPSTKHQIKVGIGSKVKLFHIEESVEQAIELVRRNALTEMDGRDLARIIAIESNNDTHCYTASLERGSAYTSRHATANFNRPSFCSDIKKVYGKGIKFRQIILDYFWVPTGTWQSSHWKASFFNNTLPDFVREGLIDFNPGMYDEDDLDSFSASGKGGGVVYLPFCLHCVQQIIAAYDILSKYYTIEFLHKCQLDQHALWAGTSTIDAKAMQNWLGKNINQEDAYCTITHSEVFGSGIDSNVTKEELLDLLRRIEDIYHVRMIKLKALQMYNPSHPEYNGSKNNGIANSDDDGNQKKRKKLQRKRSMKKEGAVLGITKGGFVGLKKKGRVKNGFDQKER